MSVSITKHAKERYAQRIMDKDDRTDIAVYVAQNDEKIVKDINKMVEYGTLLYSGLPSHTGQNPTDVYRNGFWIVLVDSKQRCVITLFRIDFGFGDEFNNIFIQKALEEIELTKNELGKCQNGIDSQISCLQELIKDNNMQIVEYKKLIKGLEALNISYQDTIDSITISVEIARSKLHDSINKLIRKHEF